MYISLCNRFNCIFLFIIDLTVHCSLSTRYVVHVSLTYIYDCSFLCNTYFTIHVYFCWIQTLMYLFLTISVRTTSKDFYLGLYPLHFCPFLILQKEPVFNLLILSAKQGNYWYNFYNVFGMRRSLTGDWTRDLPHSKPALYH